MRDVLAGDHEGGERGDAGEGESEGVPDEAGLIDVEHASELVLPGGPQDLERCREEGDRNPHRVSTCGNDVPPVETMLSGG